MEVVVAHVLVDRTGVSIVAQCVLSGQKGARQVAGVRVAYIRLGVATVAGLT